MTKIKNKISSLAESFAEGWRALVTLVRMQLKEKMDLSYFRSKRALTFKIIWLIIEFVAITAAIAVVFYFVKILGLFSLVQDIPVSVISLIFAIMMLFSIITDTVGLMKSLYFSKDNSVLLTLPATPSLVFLSKLATYYVYEFRKSFMFTIPMFIAYGIIKGYAIYFYPWLLLMFALIGALPVLISALLSIPSMFIYIFLNRVKVLQYVLYTLAAALVVGAAWILIGLIPENINFIETWGETYWQIQDFLKSYTITFSPMYKFTELIVGKTAGITTTVFHNETLVSLLIVTGISVVSLILCFVCSKPLFCRMAATPFEFKKNNAAKEKPNSKRPPFISALRKEWISGMRSNSFIKLFGIVAVIMPTAIYLLNKLYTAMNTRFIGTQMTICFNVVIMLLILLMTNIDIASVYSRDGSSAYLNKVQPAPYATLLFAKLFFPMIIGFIGVAITTAVFATFKALAVLDTAMLGVTVYGVFVAHMFSSAESDIMKPQYEQYKTFNEQANNPNESASAVLAIILSVVVFIIALFLSSNTNEGVWVKLAIVSLIMAGAKAFTYVSKIKAFYKENQ